AEAGDNRRHQRKFARRQQRARPGKGWERREVGRTFGHASCSPNTQKSNRRRGGATLSGSTWGLSPYSALAAELNFGNEGRLECGRIAQVQQGLAATRSPGIRPKSKAANRPSDNVPETPSIPLLRYLFQRRPWRLLHQR